MFISTSRSRRHRNAVEEQKPDPHPFFSGTAATGVQTKKEPTFFQAKLSIGKPNDKYEKEADSVANTVVNQRTAMPVVQQKRISSIQRLTSGQEEEKLSTNDARMRKDKEIQAKPDVQRLCANCEKEKETGVQRMTAPEKKEEEKKLQTKTEGGTATASSSLSGRIETTSGKGKPLSSKTLNEMNSSFGADFSRVNIHIGTDAVQMNKELHAQAFTHGRDIYFNSGKYDTESSGGKQLLAHELTHVIQQGQAPGKTIQRASSTVDATHDLKSERFKGDPDLEGCYDDNTRLTLNGQGLEGTRKVEKGPGVKKVKEALVELGYLKGPVNDVYTQETWDAVKKLKSDKNLGWEDMGDVGPGTMAWLDDHFASKKEEPKKEEPKKEEPKKDEKLCGPDITQQLKNAQLKTRKHFAGWSNDRKETACQHLVSIFFGPIAWDIIELNESDWIRKDYGPACASEGADPSCIKSVQVDNKCFYAGSVNYVHFGNMFDLCEGYYAKAYPLNKQFTQNEMLAWISLYKGPGLFSASPNFKASCDWALVGYFNWPHGALTPDADRGNCSPSCPIAYKGKDFTVNWDGENF